MLRHVALIKWSRRIIVIHSLMIHQVKCRLSLLAFLSYRVRDHWHIKCFLSQSAECPRRYMIIDGFLLHFKKIANLVRLKRNVLDNWCSPPSRYLMIILHCCLREPLQEILMLLHVRQLMWGLHRHLVKFTLWKYLICVLINVLLGWAKGVDWVVRDDVDTSLRPQFFLRRILDVVVFCNPSSIVREWRKGTQLAGMLLLSVNQLMLNHGLMRFHVVWYIRRSLRSRCLLSSPWGISLRLLLRLGWFWHFKCRI
jgi:hypothetical protein